MTKTSIMDKKQRKVLLPKLAFLLMLLSCVLLSVFFLMQGAELVSSSADTGLNILVIDPGHGGFDGGAISDDGSKESDINLAIALKLRCLSELLGQPLTMTREDDRIRSEYAKYSEHEDLVRRTEIVNDTPGAILISIHQNDFPTGQPSGAQVLYAASFGSEELGRRCHQNLITQLDPQNRRVAEPAPKALYITSHVGCPAILVECGFMSNNFEVQKLCSSAYQCSIALVLTASLLQYLSEAEML